MSTGISDGHAPDRLFNRTDLAMVTQLFVPKLASTSALLRNVHFFCEIMPPVRSDSIETLAKLPHQIQALRDLALVAGNTGQEAGIRQLADLLESILRESDQKQLHSE